MNKGALTTEILHYAATYRNERIVTQLLDLGIDQFEADNVGWG